MSKGEEIIAKILTKSKVIFEQEKTFYDLKHGSYRYDFYIPDYKGHPIIIEYNGAQHYQYVKQFYANERWWRAALERDRRKISYALANDIPLYIIPYWDQPNLKTLSDLFKPEYRAHSRWHNDEARENYNKSK